MDRDAFDQFEFVSVSLVMSTGGYLGISLILVLLIIIVYVLYRFLTAEPVPRIVLPNQVTERVGFQTPGSGYGSGWETPK